MTGSSLHSPRSGQRLPYFPHRVRRLGFSLLALWLITLSLGYSIDLGSIIVEAKGDEPETIQQESTATASPLIGASNIGNFPETPWIDNPPAPSGEKQPEAQTPASVAVPPESPVANWRPPLYPVPWAPSAFDHFYFKRPIAVDQVNWPVEDYRYGAVLVGSDVVHSGVDIDAPAGTPVLAAGSGRVIWAGYGLLLGDPQQKDPYGLAVAIRHDFGYQNQPLFTVYAHMSKLFVEDGQFVAAGDALGEVGNTGNTTGPHLHFEVRVGANLYTNIRNPELWTSPPQGWGLLVGRIMDTGGQPVESQLVLLISKETGASWWVKTYGGPIANSDPYYQENMVFSDIPEGDFTVRINYLNRWFTKDVHIHAGQVTYITMTGRNGFSDDSHPEPGPSLFVTPTP